MSFESLKDKIGKSVNKNQWQELHSKKKNNLSGEYIFVRYTPYQSKSMGEIHRFRISIGEKVASLFDLHQGKRVNVFIDKHNPALFLLKVSDNDNGYLLSKAKESSVLMLNCVMPYELNIPKYATLQVFFDVESDNSIMIDINKKPK